MTVRIDGGCGGDASKPVKYTAGADFSKCPDPQKDAVTDGIGDMLRGYKCDKIRGERNVMFQFDDSSKYLSETEDEDYHYKLMAAHIYDPSGGIDENTEGGH